MTQLKIGDKAPKFQAQNQKGETISLKNFKGKKVILFFYPRDNTPTCTIEACNFRDHYETLLKKDIIVLGISGDGLKSHQKFATKFNLPFDLLVDENLEISKAFGVFGDKLLFGRQYKGIIRTTFIIDEKGKILAIIDKVKSKIATEQVLEILES